MKPVGKGIDRRRFLRLGALTAGLAVGGCPFKRPVRREAVDAHRLLSFGGGEA